MGTSVIHAPGELRVAPVDTPERRLDEVYRCGADGVPEFVERGAPQDGDVHAMRQTVIARLVKRLEGRCALIEQMRQNCLAEPDAAGDEARPLGTLPAAAEPQRLFTTLDKR